MKRSSAVKSSPNELIDSGGNRHQHGITGASRRGEEMQEWHGLQGVCILEFLSQVFKLRDGGAYKE